MPGHITKRNCNGSYDLISVSHLHETLCLKRLTLSPLRRVASIVRFIYT